MTSADPEQDQWLTDASENVQKQAFFMKRAFDQTNIRGALKCASMMIGELRTSKLSPRNYYDLFMNVTDELRELEMQFEEVDRVADEEAEKQGESVEDDDAPPSIVDLYENVQHAGNIVPRLYLLITVGAVYIKTQKAPAKDILFDLVELCRGVQHPMRGLFIRSYLSQITKMLMPDVGSVYEGFGGGVEDAIDFILQNFVEMNKLWVRMQHQGSVADRAKREQERRNLRQLVGLANLVRLSQLEGVTLELYQTLVLPRVLDQIVDCKDVIAQEYLMDCVIQVFPDEFHLRTLEPFLTTCSMLQEKVQLKNIIIALMNRLSQFAASSPAGTIPAEIEMFPLFHRHTSTVIEGARAMPLADVLQLQVALINFASKVYPERLDYVDHVLGFTATVLERHLADGGDASTSSSSSSAALPPACVRDMVELLSLPLQSLGLQILELRNFSALMSYLDFPTRKQVSNNIVAAITNAPRDADTGASTVTLSTARQVEAVLKYISSLIKDEDEQHLAADQDAFDFDQEQTCVARLVQFVHSDDTDVHYKLLQTVRKYFGQGGTRRIAYTLPPLVFAALRLADRIYTNEQAAAAVAEDGDDDDEEEEEIDEDDEEAVAARDEKRAARAAKKLADGGGKVIKAKKLFGFIHETVSVLSPHFPDTALRLFLQSAHRADLCGYEAIVYEFVAQAFIVYEDEVTDSKQQFATITLISNTLQQFTSLGEENYDTLVSKATQHSAKLLKKVDQCRAVFTCSHLFWPGDSDDDDHVGRDAKRVLACLQRSLKIAYGCMGSQVHLFIDILNKYIFFFDRGCPAITVKYIQGLIALIDEHLPQLQDGGDDGDETSRTAKKHYQATLAHIRWKQSLDDDVGARYQALDIDGSSADSAGDAEEEE